MVKSASEAAPARHTGHTAQHRSGPDRTARPLPPSLPRTVRGTPPLNRRVAGPQHQTVGRQFCPLKTLLGSRWGHAVSCSEGAC